MQDVSRFHDYDFDRANVLVYYHHGHAGPYPDTYDPNCPACRYSDHDDEYYGSELPAD